MTPNKSNRRQFIKQAAIAGAVAACPSVLKHSAIATEPSGKSRLVLARNTDVLSGSVESWSGIRTDVLAEMLDASVARLTGHSDPAAAWQSLFRPDDVVGIKVNCLFGRGASTHPEVAHAAAEALVRAGVKPSRIIIWDRATRDLLKSGYTINRDGDGVRVFANDGVWEDEPVTSGLFTGRLTRIITRDITALINIPFMKDHNISGITGALKNHYGSIDNPRNYHGNRCDPYIADINQIPAIRDKTRLIILDALRPMANGGPGLRRDAVWDHHSLLISRDPVAVDHMAWKIIDDRRRETGLPALAETGREPISIATAAGRGLGVNNIDNMEVVRLG